MDATQADQLARRLWGLRTRRDLARALSGVAAAPLLSGANVAAGKKKRPVCLDGKTIKATPKKRKKLLKRGATTGACPGGCSPQCNGVSCGGSDGCGGTCGCAAGSICHEGACTPCTVACTGTPLACGIELDLALEEGGTIFACPGRYLGSFDVRKNTTLVGAGSGDDPATSTILDAGGANQHVVHFTKNGTQDTLRLTGLRVTGARYGASGGGLYLGEGLKVRVTNCAITGNKADASGGGIWSRADLRLENSTVTDNESGTVGINGGGIALYAGRSVITDCVIANNTSHSYGGGLYLQGAAAEVTVTGTEIRENQALRGGGIALDVDATVTLDSATSVTGNTASELGGGVACFTGTFTQNGATISGNFAPRQI
ncbi:MAG: right-handed parallel beta-helix repeat-containing protein, partial [Thermomicrobiales bacterium]|nr:right-handed parallel beta-helix repeat-containing protein [Thermomicrobiales bacterium]